MEGPVSSFSSATSRASWYQRAVAMMMSKPASMAVRTALPLAGLTLWSDPSRVPSRSMAKARWVMVGRRSRLLLGGLGRLLGRRLLGRRLLGGGLLGRRL